VKPSTGMAALSLSAAKGGTAEVFQYRDRKNGRIVADVVRIGKGTPRGWNPPSRNA
jgi:hypothetical protein